MKWFYAEGGKQIGPVEESVLDDLVRQGVVRDDTLVWREGMGAWQKHGAVRGGSNSATGAPSAPSGAVSAAPVSGNDTRYCSECGRAVAASQITNYGDVSVCAQCQPAYSQRVSGAKRHFGGFWMRFLARLIDGFVVIVAIGVLVVPLVLLTGGFGVLMSRNGPFEPGAGVAGGTVILIIMAAIVIPALYEIYFMATRAATLGKMALGLKIIRADGAPITTGLAVGRYFAHVLTSIVPLAIGYIIAAFDREKRSLHDHICGTRVIYTR